MNLELCTLNHYFLVTFMSGISYHAFDAEAMDLGLQEPGTFS